MSTSAVSFDPTAIDVAVSDDLLRVTLADGREVAKPPAWFSRLRDASAEQQRHWRLIGRGAGIHWPGIDEPGIDEDVSVRGLLDLPT